jgi:hypothetical protein
LGQVTLLHNTSSAGPATSFPLGLHACGLHWTKRSSASDDDDRNQNHARVKPMLANSDVYKKAALVTLYSMWIITLYSMWVMPLYSMWIMPLFSMKIVMLYSMKIETLYSMKIETLYSMKIETLYSMKIETLYSMWIMTLYSMKIVITSCRAASILACVKITPAARPGTQNCQN